MKENELTFATKKQRIALTLSMSVNFLTILGKIVLSIITRSGFLAVSALVTFLSLMTKLIAFFRLTGRANLSELKAFLLMALTISVGALCYATYMARLFFFPTIQSFDIYQGLAIAAFAFIDLGWALTNLIKEKKDGRLVMIGLRYGSLSNGLSAIVLAQIAILAFTNPGKDFSFDNALAGLLFGMVDLLIGVAMVIRYFKEKRNGGQNAC